MESYIPAALGGAFICCTIAFLVHCVKGIDAEAEKVDSWRR